MGKTISIVNMKGGVGKSTLTVNLAWHFAAYSDWLKKVLVVDLDPQFNASQYLLGWSRYEKILNDKKPTMWDIFEQHTVTPAGRSASVDPHDAIHNVASIRGGGEIDLIPSRLEMAFTVKHSGLKAILLERSLKRVRNEYDLILIDNAPTESILTEAAYLASDYLLVPVRPEYLSTIGLPLLVNSMENFKVQYDVQELELAGIVFNAMSDYSPEEIRSREEVKKLAKKNGWYVFSAEIKYSRSYPKGAREGKPIFRTSYSRTDQATRFRMFAEEFAERVNL